MHADIYNVDVKSGLNSPQDIAGKTFFLYPNLCIVSFPV